MIEKLACSLGRNDEEPNIELAVYLCNCSDKKAIAEIVDGLNGSDKAIANDSIKVLYEIGERKPELIADYVDSFISHLLSKNNRLAWGSMIALAKVADLKPDKIFHNIKMIQKAYETGSVITIDNSMTVFAKLCKADNTYEKELFPLLINHLSSCRPKEVPQHAERISICINKNNANMFVKILKEREAHLTISQVKRIEKLIKQLEKDDLL
jgi:hypothetical protein